MPFPKARRLAGALTLGIQHLLDGATYASRFSQNHKFEAITGDESHVLAQTMIRG